MKTTTTETKPEAKVIDVFSEPNEPDDVDAAAIQSIDSTMVFI
jgi:hypothetical protein